MSKVDALRAMREARFAAQQAKAAAAAGAPAAAKARPPAAARPVRPVPDAEGAVPSGVTAASPAAAEPVEDAEEPSLCGHQNMSGKACRRPAGHSEKNHRYR